MGEPERDLERGTAGSCVNPRTQVPSLRMLVRYEVCLLTARSTGSLSWRRILGSFCNSGLNRLGLCIIADECRQHIDFYDVVAWVPLVGSSRGIACAVLFGGQRGHQFVRSRWRAIIRADLPELQSGSGIVL